MNTTDTAPTPTDAPSAANPRRRNLLRAAGAAALAAPALIRPLPQLPACSAAALTAAAAAFAPGRSAWAQGQPLKKLTFGWYETAFCLTPIGVAQDQGFFRQNGLDVDFVSYSSGNGADQLLESLSTGKADAAVGMIHQWLKPLEAGFDAKIIASIHGGCVRLLGATQAGATTLAALKGKTIGISDMTSPGKQFFAIFLLKNDIDPDKDVQWRQYPADMLGIAADKGEIQAIAGSDPSLYLIQKHNPGRYVELATNLSGDYAHKVCCVIGASGKLVRNDRPAAAALARALVQAAEYTHHNPGQAVKSFLRFAPKSITPEDLSKLYATLTYDHHPTGTDLQQEIAYYAQDFQRIGVLKKNTDPQRLAQQIYVNVLG